MLFEFARRYSESAWARVVTAKRVHRALSKFARSRSEGALTRNPRRGFIGHFTNLHGATARALGRAGSLQRVHRALSKFARRHSEGAVARAILAEGSSGALQIRTAPQWERFEAREPCRGFIGHSTNTRNVENDRGLTKSRMNTPHTANIDAGSYGTHVPTMIFLGNVQINFGNWLHLRWCGCPLRRMCERAPLPTRSWRRTWTWR